LQAREQPARNVRPVAVNSTDQRDTSKKEKGSE
jgi:hypothetical protein